MRLRDTPLLAVLFCAVLTISCLQSADGQAGELVLTPGPSASTLAGTGKQGYKGDGSSALVATLARPSSVAYAPNGDLYVADTNNHVVRRVTANGTISTIAGNGIQGFGGDGGPANQASLDSPGGLTVGSDGTLYIADTRNQRVRRVSVAGVITTIAGSGTAGFSGDGGDARASQLRNPAAIALGLAGEIYITDSGNHRVRRVARDGTITTVAGNGVQGATGDAGPATQASLDSPTGLAVRVDGSLLVADRRNSRIRVVTTDGIITSLDAGTSPLRRAASVATDADGTVYIADTGHQQVRQLTSAGTGVIFGASTEGTATDAEIGPPSSIAPDGIGGLAIADPRNHQIQRFSLPRLAFADTPLGAESTPVFLSLRNAGPGELTISSISLPSGFVLAGSGTCSKAPFALAVSASCTLAVAFHPGSTGPSAGMLTVATASGMPQRALLSATALPSTTALPSSVVMQSASAVVYTGMPVQWTASVITQSSVSPSGTITFLDAGKEIGSAPLMANGLAQLSTNALGTGLHVLSARYGGDAHYASSISPTVQQTVVAAPDFTVTAGATSLSVARGGTATVSFMVQPVNGILNRSINVQVSGLPAGASVNVSPSTIALGSDPVRVDIALKVPATLALLPTMLPFVAVGLLIPSRRKKFQVALAVCTLCLLQGCGGPTGSGKAVSSSSTTYNVTVTATTIGVTGDLLLHTSTFTLAVN